MAEQKTANRLQFTKAALGRLEASGERTYFYDAGQANLAICVTANGAKVFYRTGRIEGRPTRYRLGPFPELSVENARTMAKQATGKIATGENPHSKRIAARHEHTMQGMFDHWLESHAKLHKRTWEEDQRQFDKFLAPWKTRRLSSITKADCQAMHAKVGKDHGHYAANRLIAFVRAMFNKADEIGYRGLNPTRGIKKFKEESRDRFLLPEEVPAFFHALESEPQWSNDFFMLCLLTGARRSNVQAMAWVDVHLDQASWRIPMTKSGEPVYIHLPAKAVEILTRRHGAKADSPWVFPGGKKNQAGHLSSPKARWKIITDGAGLSGLRIHDLRRTLGSWQAIAGTSLSIIGQSLGHRSQQSTVGYARLTQAPVTASVDSATSAILAAAEAKPVKKSRKTKGAGNGKA